MASSSRCTRCGTETSLGADGLCADCRQAGSPAESSSSYSRTFGSPANYLSKHISENRLPRLWPSLALGILVTPVAFVAGVMTLILCLVLFAPPDVATSQQGIVAWLEDFAAQPLGFLLLFLPGQIIIGGSAVIAAWLSPTPWWERLEMRPGRLPIWTFAIFAAATPVVPLLTELLLPWTVESPLYDLLRNASGWGAVLVVSFISIVPALTEEALFRGFIQGRLLKRWHPGFAVGLTSFLFAMAHLDPAYAVAVLPLGIWLGVLTWRAGSIWPAVFCHFVNNLLGSLAARWAPEIEGTPLEMQVYFVLWAVCGPAFLAALAVAVYYGHAQDPQDKLPPEPDDWLREESHPQEHDTAV